MADISNEKLRMMADGKYAYSRVVQILAAKLLAARAEVERLREDANTTAMDLVDERDEARADLREALSLLRNTDWEKDNWDERYEALLEKHKEMP